MPGIFVSLLEVRSTTKAVAVAVCIVNIAGCAIGCASFRAPSGLANSSTHGDTLIRVAVEDVAETPRELCPSGDKGYGKPQADGAIAAPRYSASVRRERHWVVIDLERNAPDDRSITRTHVVAAHPPQDPLELGCGRKLLFLPANEVAVGTTALPLRVVAEVSSEKIEISSKEVTLLDLRKDWDGGSGGTMVTAKVERNRLRVTSVTVSPGVGDGNAYARTIDEFDLFGFRRESLETDAGTVVIAVGP